MATRGSIPTIMAAAGISMLPPESGIPTVRRELVAGGGSGELVVAGTLGIMGAEYDPTGGLDVEKVQAELAGRKRPLLMVGRVKAARLYGGLSVETTLDPKEQPFLFDHQIDGVPVLPGVMGTEAFAEVASVLCPGFHVAAIEDESFLLPFKFFRNQPATLHLHAVASPGGVGEIVVSAELRSIVQPKPELPAQERVHFKARVRMRREAAAKPKVAFKKPAAKALGIGREPIYAVYFHGPAYQVIERAAVEGDGVVALMAAGPSPEREARRGRGARGAAAPRAVLPGGGAVAAGEEADDGPADGPRAGGGLPPGGGGGREAALRDGGGARRRARPSTHGSWTRRASSTPRSTATAPSRCPGSGRSES